MDISLDQRRRRERLGSVVAVAAIHALIGAALLFGLNPDVRHAATSALKTFDVAPPPPPPERPEPKRKVGRKEGAAAPPAQKAKPTPVVAPKPLLPLPLPPPPIVAAPVASSGNQPRSGATPLPGPGTGGGGVGNGTGSGGSGDGDGDGDGGVAEHARYIRGRIRDSDYPEGAARVRAGGVVTVEFVVETDGRVTQCHVVESSGRRDLDETTCVLIERRYRFEPARDRQGRPVPEINGWEQTWWLEGRD